MTDQETTAPVEQYREQLLCLYETFSRIMYELLTSGHKEDRKLGLEIFTKLVRMAEAVEWNLDDASPEVRVAAATAIGHMWRRKAPAFLIELLGDKEAEVRRAAAIALGRIGSPIASAALRQVANTDDSFDVRHAAKAALARIQIAATDISNR